MVDIGKFVSRSLGIGEESVDEAIRVGAAIVTGDISAGIKASSDLARSEQQRNQRREEAEAYQNYKNQREAEMASYNNPNIDYLRTYSDPRDDLGGITDRPEGMGVYEGSAGAIVQYGARAIQQIARSFGGRGAAAGAVGGVATGALMNGGDSCGCKPKVFIRFNNCGQPIITRKMKQQAVAAVNCMGADVAAQTLTGGSLELLTMVISKTFPPRKSGISGAQLATTEKTQRKLMRMHKRMTDACKTAPIRRR